MNQEKISIIIPVYNEKDNLNELYNKLKKIMNEFFAGFEYEIIFVDDGSKDGSFEILKSIHDTDNNVKIIKFSKNFGQHIAIKAGIDMADGDYTVLTDADMQDDPASINDLYGKLKEGYDVVIGIRENRQDGFFKKISSSLFFKTMNGLSKVKMQENQAMLRIFNKKVLNTLKNMQELSQNNGAFLAWMGFEQGTLPIRHQKRSKGKTKYTLLKSLRFASETIMNFSNKPLIYISIFGMFVSVCSIIFSIFIIYQKLFHDVGLIGWASTVTFISFFSGMILFSLGVVGLYIGKLYQQSLGRPLYIIKDKIE